MDHDNRKIWLACILAAFGSLIVSEIALGHAYHAEKAVHRPEKANLADLNRDEASKLFPRVYDALKRP